LQTPAKFELIINLKTAKAVDVKSRISPARYDQIVYGLRAVLQPYSIVGLHCTKLTEEEIQHILANGMQPPDGKMLALRLQ
jgi:hypothetical protein